MPPIVSNSQLYHDIVHDVTAGSLVPGTASLLGLFMNDYIPLPSTQIGDLMIATYTGYAGVTLPTWSAIIDNPDGSVKAVASELFVYTPTASTVGNIIYGCYLLDHAGVLIGAYRFPTPYPMMATVDSIVLALSLLVSGNGTFIDITEL